MDNMKNSFWDAVKAAIIAIALLASVFVLSNAFIGRNKESEVISVTGLGTKSFTADLIVLSGSFKRVDMSLKNAYAQLNGDQALIIDFLKTKNISESEYVFSAINIEKEYDMVVDKNGNQKSTFKGYALQQTVTIESSDVDKVENVSREITEVIDKGVEFYSQEPQYYFTKLAELKMELIENATIDARERAEKIAEMAGARLGRLKYSNMGVFQIIARNSSEDYSWDGAFNTTSKHKTATVTARLQFGIK